MVVVLNNPFLPPNPLYSTIHQKQTSLNKQLMRCRGNTEGCPFINFHPLSIYNDKDYL
ncbi:hypothetical protein BGS_0584 [Beggiatoa sp. SS]|nr:hypothetical protein BGS_0584 [Beggiatoa sp. SS]